MWNMIQNIRTGIIKLIMRVNVSLEPTPVVVELDSGNVAIVVLNIIMIVVKRGESFIKINF